MSNIAHQKYFRPGPCTDCNKSALSGVVGGCPRVAWPISSWHAAFVVCKFVSRNASNLNQNNAKMSEISLKSHPKSSKMVPRSVPNMFFEVGLFRDP